MPKEIIINSFELITLAASFAADKHAHQRRRISDVPYILHPARVAAAAARHDLTSAFIAACYLHDTLEDTATTEAELLAIFPSRTVELVQAVTYTKEPGSSFTAEEDRKLAYYDRIIRVPGAPLLKILDRTDNLLDLAKIASIEPEWARRYVAETRRYFRGILQVVVAPLIVSEYDAALTNLETIIAEGADV